MQNYIVEYLTDVEGNWEYFCRFVECSSILEWDDAEQGVYGPGRLQMKEDGILVFGGDACDKGPGDIRFVRILLGLYSRYPERVFIILGNRDINKLRFYAELQPGVEPLDSLPWDRNAKSLAEWCVEQKLTDTPVTRLRWMLHFMGCQRTTFKTRRQELALLSATHSATDQDVLQSFRESVDPAGKDPFMLVLLRVGKLAVVLGDTLFVHGGFHEAVVEKVPMRFKCVDCESEGHFAGDIKQWAQDLNAWKDTQLDAFMQQPAWRQDGKGGRMRGGEDLILYGTPGYPGNATVVYFNPFKDGNPQLLPPHVEDYLKSNGIKRVLSGHQPHGQSPTVVRHPRTGLLTITADTSYSNPDGEKLFNDANNRGAVTSIVRLEGDWLEITGTLVDGKRHKCRLHTNDEMCKMPDRLVGRQQSDGSWIKTVLEGDQDRDSVQSVIGKGPPRFDLITQTLSTRMANFNLSEAYRDSKFFMPHISAEDVMFGKSAVGRNLSAYSGELQMEEKVTKRARSCLDIFTDLHYRMEEFREADTYICSWLGVVDRLTGGPEMEAKVVAKINELLQMGKRVIFVSNSSHWSRKEFSEKVVKKGINMTKQDAMQNVLNTACTAAWYLKTRNKQRPFVICSEKGLLEELRARGITQYVATLREDGAEKKEYLEKATAENVMKLIKANPQVDSVVMGWDFHLTALKVAVASNYIRWSAEEESTPLGHKNSSEEFLVVTCSSDSSGILGVSPENYMPERNFNNKPVWAPGNGSMAGFLAFQEQGLALDVGKPSEIMLKALRGDYKVNLENAVVIGDTLEPDILWAHKGAMKSLLVLSGRTDAQTARKVEAGSYTGHTPTWILNSLADC